MTRTDERIEALLSLLGPNLGEATSSKSSNSKHKPPTLSDGSIVNGITNLSFRKKEAADHEGLKSDFNSTSTTEAELIDSSQPLHYPFTTTFNSKNSDDNAHYFGVPHDDRTMQEPKCEPRFGSSSLIPHIVAQGIFDVLRDEMLRLSGEHYLLGGPLENGGTLRESKQIQAILLNCSLVQRSWFVEARRAAGSFFSKSAHRLPHSFQTPFFGDWTREVHLDFTTVPPLLATELLNLFEYTPNVKSLVLDFRISFCNMHNPSGVAYMISDRISRRLRLLEEISYNFHEIMPDEAVDSFLAFPNGAPRLRALRISGLRVKLASDPQHLCTYPLPTNFAALEMIHLQLSTADYLEMGDGLRSISYRRGATGIKKFIPRALSCVMQSPVAKWMESELDVAVLSTIHRLRVAYDVQDEPDPVSPQSENGIRRLFEACRSLNTLQLLYHITSHNSITDVNSPLHTFGSLSPTVEDIHIKLSIHMPMKSVAEAHGLADRAMVFALMLLESRKSKLRCLAVDIVLPLWEKSMGKLLKVQMPHSEAWCARNAVSFSGDTLNDKLALW
ncbi:hypothetical protein SCHPADRAFT_1001924 [Schizopora paradoxa]|uniref:Uncharacterized protein n=1 Tax=Schizopora paradoxa TaxID=27342 RepID=A0A0H2RC56_9AGAM|nr:hypothetical protein SCHPADRAFT_1001924 [Schizopora paradoxa]